MNLRPARPLVAALVSLTLLAVSASAQTVRTIRWAVIGDVTTNWTARASIRLPTDSLRTFIFDEGTVLRSGDSSYWASGRLAQVFAYEPDIVSIQLGSADSKAVNWDDSARFAADYKALIDTLASMPSKPRILVVYPTPVMPDTGPTNLADRNNRVISKSIIPRLRAIAQEKGADTVNLYTPLAWQIDRYLGPGSAITRTTPNTVGQDTLGRLLYEAFVDQSIRIMCVGNSITEATSSSIKQKYTSRLRMMLGKRYWVWNGGKSGWWMQRAQLPGANSSYKSYVTDKPLMDTLFLRKPHFITVKLGTNDARQNFWQTPRFLADYRHFIDTLGDNIAPKPKFVLFKAYPAWRVNGNWPFANSGYTGDQNGINGDIIRDSLGPAIDAIAASRPTKVAGVVDLYSPFAGPTQVFASDGVHPNAAGQDSMARVIYRSLLPIVTSIRSATPGNASPAATPAFSRVYLAGGRIPERLLGARLFSLNGKAVRIGASGTLPAGVYLVKPMTPARAGAGR
jgi:hypothetical protein